MTKDEFLNELKKLNVEITEEKLNQLEDYYNLLVKENENLNLTAITEKKDVYLKHFYDSLTISKVIDLTKEISIIDIGTGAGFPGLVLKIIYPNIKITLLDSLEKRIKFLNKVIEKLELKDIKTVHSRIEDYNEEKYDYVVSRAVAKTNILVELSYKLLKENCSYVFLKANIDEELKESENAFKVLNLKLIKKEEFLLPIENSKRTIIEIQKQKEIKNKYPRKFSQIKKNPL